MIPGCTPTSPSMATAASPRAISVTSSVRRKKRLNRRKDAVDPCLRRAQAVRSTSIFAASVDDVLARCRRQLARPSRPRTPQPPHPAVPAGRNSAWSRARSRCCRGTGNGWRSNRAALRSRCAGWSTRQGAPTRTRTGSGTRRKRPIASSRRWAENKPHYEEVARALFAGDAGRFEAWTASWPADVRDHARRLAAAAFERAASQQAPPVDPAKMNR